MDAANYLLDRLASNARAHEIELFNLHVQLGSAEEKIAEHEATISRLNTELSEATSE